MRWNWRRAAARVADIGRVNPASLTQAMDKAWEAKAEAAEAKKAAMEAQLEALRAQREANGVWVETQMLGEIVASLLARVAFEAGKGGNAEAHLDMLLAIPLGIQELSEQEGDVKSITARRRRVLAHLGEAARTQLAMLSRG